MEEKTTDAIIYEEPKQDNVAEGDSSASPIAQQINAIEEMQAEKGEENEFLTALSVQLRRYFENVKRLVSYSKSKDDSLLKLSKELEQYRADFAFTACKPLIVSLITFREECKSDRRSIVKYNSTKVQIEKKAGYLTDSFDLLFETNGVMRQGTEYYYKGRLIYPLTLSTDVEESAITPNTAPEEEPQQLLTVEVTSEAQLIELLCEYQRRLEIILAANAAQDELVTRLLAQNAAIERGNRETLQNTLLYSVIGLYEKTEKGLAELKNGFIDDATAREAYLGFLEALESKIEGCLNRVGVRVEREVTDEFVPIKHQVMKRIPLPEGQSEKERTIAARYTDCYVYENKTIAPAKVDVYVK